MDWADLTNALFELGSAVLSWMNVRWADFANASFEMIGAALNWMNVRQLWKDKKVRGVYVPAWMLFTLWGFWNLYYYPSLGQWASFFAGVVMVIANTAWVALAIRYRGR